MCTHRGHVKKVFIFNGFVHRLEVTHLWWILSPNRDSPSFVDLIVSQFGFEILRFSLRVLRKGFDEVILFIFFSFQNEHMFEFCLSDIIYEQCEKLVRVEMVGPTLFHRRKHSWPPEEFISKATLQLVTSIIALLIMEKKKKRRTGL